jgi:D-cysteine desulfhydrase
MNLRRFPRCRYSEGATPLEFLPHFTNALAGPNLWIERDDMLELAPGGNKTHKLEFLVADALAQGTDAVIT